MALPDPALPEAPAEGLVLVTGASGQLGTELRALLPVGRALFADLAEGPDTLTLDIADARAVRALFRERRIAAVVNAAAYTAVDKAEAEPALAERVNAEGPGILAAACAEADARLVHVSTDFVFGGDAASAAERRPLRPEDPVAPLSVYGRSKAEGEQRVLATCPRAVVLRTAWLYSAHGGNFVKTMLRLGRERDTLGVVDDQHGTPTWARDLARAVLPFLDEPLTAADYGIYHYTNAGRTTWAGFARAIMEGAGLSCTVQGIPTEAYPTPARRPAWSVLDTTRWTERFGPEPPAWEASLAECLPLLLS
jgi:dTDP-4-dehydrorhamnose reductase